MGGPEAEFHGNPVVGITNHTIQGAEPVPVSTQGSGNVFKHRYKLWASPIASSTGPEHGAIAGMIQHLREFIIAMHEADRSTPPFPATCSNNP
jgi:hypothetical protein